MNRPYEQKFPGNPPPIIIPPRTRPKSAEEMRAMLNEQGGPVGKPESSEDRAIINAAIRRLQGRPSPPTGICTSMQHSSGVQEVN